MTSADQSGAPPAEHPGARFGLPEAGVGAVASTGARVLAFVMDLAVSFGVALLFTRPELPRNWALLVWAVMTVAMVAVFGATPGQALLGIRVARVDGRAFVGLWAVPRTALTFLIVPVLVMDADGRGLHDRACRTVVIRTR